jgi:arabinogalactan endo-1,4-beta-galactosidase
VQSAYYPFYKTSATLSNLKSSLTNLVNKLNKPIIIAETDWPYTCSGGPQMSEPSVPIGTSGQQTWITDIKNVLTSLPNGRGAGIRKLHRLAKNLELTVFSLLGAGVDWQCQPWLGLW